MKKNNKSILQNILQDVYDCKEFKKAKDIIERVVRESKISGDSKLLMMSNLREIEKRYGDSKLGLQKLQMYATNSMFKKLGMGI